MHAAGEPSARWQHMAAAPLGNYCTVPRPESCFECVFLRYRCIESAVWSLCAWQIRNSAERSLTPFCPVRLQLFSGFVCVMLLVLNAGCGRCRIRVRVGSTALLAACSRTIRDTTSAHTCNAAYTWWLLSPHTHLHEYILARTNWYEYWLTLWLLDDQQRMNLLTFQSHFVFVLRK